MGRRWVPLVIVVLGAALGLAVAGFPNGVDDDPIAVQTLEDTTTSIPSTSTPSTSAVVASSTTVTSPPEPTRPPGEVGVMVFNASGVPGSATRFGTTIKANGWDVRPPGADRPAQDETAIVYRPGYQSEAQALATELGLDAGVVAPLDAPVTMPESADLGVLVGATLAKRVN